MVLQQGGAGTATCKKQGNAQTGFIGFHTADGGHGYSLQLYVVAGTATLPADKPTSFVGFFDTSDSKAEWSAGTNLSKTVTGVITMSDDLTHGTIDTDMLPEPPSPNPALKPIHVKGSFSCP